MIIAIGVVDSPNSLDKVRLAAQAILTVGIAVWFFVCYGMYKSEPCDKPIPVFLLVTGITQLVLLIISFVLTFTVGGGVTNVKGKGGCGYVSLPCKIDIDNDLVSAF